MSSPSPGPVAAPELEHTLSRCVLTRGVDGSSPPPGAVLAVSSPAGRTAVAAGHRQLFDDAGPLAHPLPMTTGTAHDLGSVTKVLATTSALLSRVDRGDLALDAPLSALLPAARASQHGQVTCRDLLLHRAGLWEWWPTYVSARTPADAIELVLRLPARHQPGAGRHYSDLGFMLLGAVVADGHPLAEVVAELVLQPLHLAQTSYTRPRTDEVACGAPGDVIERRMLRTGEPYPVPVAPEEFDGWRDTVRVGEVDDGNSFHAFGGAAGHAGLFSIADDVLRWGEALLDSLHRSGPWQRDTVEQFFAAGPDEGQLLGFRSLWTRSDSCVAEVIGHPGFPGVAAGVLPEHDACVVLLTNRLHLPDPHRAATMDAVWRAVLDDVHAMLHDEASTEVSLCG